MTKDQLIQELKDALTVALNWSAVDPPEQYHAFCERCTELVKTVPLTETEERIAARVVAPYDGPSFDSEAFDGQ